MLLKEKYIHDPDAKSCINHVVLSARYTNATMAKKKKKSSWNSSMNIWLDVRPTLQDGSHNRQCLGNQEPELDSSEL